MRRVILIKYSEIGLKGKNRKAFEDALISNIRKVTGWNVLWRWGRIVADVDWEAEDPSPLERIFGVQNYSLAYVTDLDMEEIERAALDIAKRNVDSGKKTFKVHAKRSVKVFPYGVYDINKIVGAKVLSSFPDLSVDVHTPDFVVNIEVKEKEAYVYSEKFRGLGGLPVGSSGRAVLLLSGGIDSPVAGWYAMKRGVKLDLLSFTSPPYTKPDTRSKLIDLAKTLWRYSGGRNLHLHICPLTPVLELLKERAPARLLLVLQRRSMMRIAERLSKRIGASAVYTGESVGQVASQTLENMMVIGEATRLPIIRPLAGFDKVEIVDKAKEIGTYDISIRPQVDVCSLFVPKRPVTKANLEKVLDVESEMGEDLVKAEEESFAMMEKVVIDGQSVDSGG